MKLEKIVKISGNIVIRTGLHIGAGNDNIHIGGVDNAVVRDPITKKPYIPGSSLKGKIRTLLEWATGRVKIVKEEGVPYYTNDPDDPVVRIFGNGQSETKNTAEPEVKKSAGPTRVSFSDCFLEEDDKLSEIGYTEIKTEVMIDRIKGTASGPGPRSTERVPAGAKFKFVITYKIFDEKDKDNLDLLLLGMRLLENDALGGSTSRGYGRIKFEEVNIENIDKNFNDIKLSNGIFKNWELKGA